MPLIAMLVAAQSVPLAPPPACRAAGLRLSLDGRDGDFDGMSHSGTELSIRNLGPDCLLPGLPTIELRDRRGRRLPAVRREQPDMPPGRAVALVRLGGGHRAAIALRWVSGPVFPRNRRIRAATISVRIGGAVLRARLNAVLYGPAGQPVGFDQPPLRASKGMAAG